MPSAIPMLRRINGVRLALLLTFGLGAVSAGAQVCPVGSSGSGLGTRVGVIPCDWRNGATQPAASPGPVCVKKLYYLPTILGSPGNKKLDVGLCVYLAAVKSVNNSCAGSQAVDLGANQKLNWVQTYITNADSSCTINSPHKDFCEKFNNLDAKLYGPLYRPDWDPHPGGTNIIFSTGQNFESWKERLTPQGQLEIMFRDVPNRTFDENVDPTCGSTTKTTKTAKQTCNSTIISTEDARCKFSWHTAPECPEFPTNYQKPVKPRGYEGSISVIDNDLRLVRYPEKDTDRGHFDYTPLIRIRYGFSIDRVNRTVTVDPLYIGTTLNGGGATQENDGILVDQGGTIGIDDLVKMRANLPLACTQPIAQELAGPEDKDKVPVPFNFPYNSR